MIGKFVVLILKYSRVPLGFTQESVEMKVVHREMIAEASGVEPILLPIINVSHVLRTRLHWTSIPFEAYFSEDLIKMHGCYTVQVQGARPFFDERLPLGWHFRIKGRQQVYLLTCCQEYSSPPNS